MSHRRRRQAPRHRPHERSRDRSPQGMPADQPLLRDVRAALRTPDPVPLLALASSMIEVAGPKPPHPFAPEPAAEELPTLDELVDSFIGTPVAETTALLTVLAHLTDDAGMADRIRRALTSRHHPMPAWLRGLENAVVEESVLQLVDDLGDASDYLLTVTLPGAFVTLVALVDRHLDGAVKDAFAIPRSGTDVVIDMREELPPGVAVQRADAKEARAVLERGIVVGERYVPPLESDSWPQCRPLLEWVLRLLPAGGVAPERREWSPQERAGLVEAVLGAPEARELVRTDRADAEGLLSSLIDVALDRGTGDPLRWSAQGTEIALGWASSKVIAERSYLRRYPDALAVLVAYGHRVTSISADLTTEVLAALDGLRAQFEQALDGGLEGTTGLIADQLAQVLGLDHLAPDELAGLMGSLGPDGVMRLLDGAASWDDRRRQQAQDAVGGADALARLDVAPLPDEPLDLSAVPADVHKRVREWVALLDDYADHVGDIELRTAQRRFVATAAQADPAIFRRRAAVDRGAAAVAWLIGKANGLGATYGVGAGPTATELLAFFGLTGSVTQRAEPLLRAVGGQRGVLAGEVTLGRPEMLVEARRRALITERERLG